MAVQIGVENSVIASATPTQIDAVFTLIAKIEEHCANAYTTLIHMVDWFHAIILYMNEICPDISPIAYKNAFSLLGGNENPECIR
jgi:hypothetical protein